jgi:hypothetical protein
LLLRRRLFLLLLFAALCERTGRSAENQCHQYRCSDSFIYLQCGLPPSRPMLLGLAMDYCPLSDSTKWVMYRN